MNVEKLKQAEHEFLMRYPGGFEHPDMVKISKKHHPEKMNQLAQTVFAPEKFAFPEEIVNNMVKVVSQSSMISLFEKPKFRDFVNTLNADERMLLAKGLEETIHGNQEMGFQWIIDILLIGKMAKWPIVTICPVYYRPTVEVFVKPTTAKFIVQQFELKEIKYQSRPNFDFYQRFKEYIDEMKTLVSPTLSPSNPAFTGFLMMGMPEHNLL
ncbi:MAG: hypothetical protein CVU84_08950 [Firmicutes bacterium HGW-Firmicutes-1]|jgi:hypothetical protein|nr:MAG: hypothetical protein CVU84_08950 [Firmicutes bacterium HGW-Firmicutes-1]